MSDDLVKQLRDLEDHASFEPHMHHTAADRIEELEAENAPLKQMWWDAGDWKYDLTEATMQELVDEWKWDNN